MKCWACSRISAQPDLHSRNNERAGAPIAVLSYSLWQKHFAGDQSIIGKTIQLNLHPYTIVGVAPKGFRGLQERTARRYLSSPRNGSADLGRWIASIGAA